MSKSTTPHSAAVTRVPPATSGETVLVKKGQILGEIEKLRNLDHHRRKLHEIQERNARKAVKVDADRFDPKDARKVQ